jgi:hypothetical protein
MNSMKLRRLLVLFHLWIAGLLAPAFLVVAISGGLYIAGIQGETQITPLPLPPSHGLELGSGTFPNDVRQLLAVQGLKLDFETVHGDADRAQTRPTTRTFLTFQQTPSGLVAAINRPDLQYALIELHKGHGPRAYRIYEIVAALALFLAVLGGITIGLLIRTFRFTTLMAVIGGSVIALVLALA